MDSLGISKVTPADVSCSDRTMIRACIFAVALAVLALAQTGKADDNATLIELPDSVLPLAVASGSTVVGGLASGGGFYWMPTTGVIYLGGLTAGAEDRI